MSITVNYRRISPKEFAELQDNPKLVEEFFYPDESTITELLDRLMQAQFDSNCELIEQLSVQLEETLYRDKASVYLDNIDITKTRLSIEKEWQPFIIC